MKCMLIIYPYPAAKMSSAKFLVNYKFHCTTKSFKVGENIVRVSNSLDLGETPSNSTSHPDSSCLHTGLW